MQTAMGKFFQKHIDYQSCTLLNIRVRILRYVRLRIESNIKDFNIPAVYSFAFRFIVVIILIIKRVEKKIIKTRIITNLQGE